MKKRVPGHIDMVIVVITHSSGALALVLLNFSRTYSMTIPILNEANQRTDPDYQSRGINTAYWQFQVWSLVYYLPQRIYHGEVCLSIEPT